MAQNEYMKENIRALRLEVAKRPMKNTCGKKSPDRKQVFVQLEMRSLQKLLSEIPPGVTIKSVEIKDSPNKSGTTSLSNWKQKIAHLPPESQHKAIRAAQNLAKRIRDKKAARESLE